jgi:hypothetical protein
MWLIPKAFKAMPKNTLSVSETVSAGLDITGKTSVSIDRQRPDATPAAARELLSSPFAAVRQEKYQYAGCEHKQCRFKNLGH